MIMILMLVMIIAGAFFDSPNQVNAPMSPENIQATKEIFYVLGACALPIGINIFLMCLGMLDEDGYHKWKNRRKA